MRKINKNIHDIPLSLKPSLGIFFPNRKYHRTSVLTHKLRKQIIRNKGYISDNKFNSRYKLSDIKQKLDNIYHKKCAFCEQKVEQSHVEHYRPKNGVNPYYWLAYSWDNLLIACPKCNESKGTKFEIEGKRTVLEISKNTIAQINTISSKYDIIEQPKLINPERTNPEDFFSFTIEGKIYSTNSKGIYTIKTCNLDRTYLRDERKKVLDEFERKVRSRVVEFKGKALKDQLSSLIKDFIDDSKLVEEKEYIGFRRYAIKNSWMNLILKKTIGK